MKKLLIALIVLPWCWQIAYAQTIWPGDVNNNGTVNGIDLLYWGWAFGAQGPQRAVAETDWQAYPAPAPWSQNFPDGLNYAYADCNGDGMVDEDDFDDAIDENFGEINPPVAADQYANASEGQAAPRLRLSTNTPLVLPGAGVNIDLSLENGSSTINNFYGIAFTLKYNPELLEGDDGPDFDLIENNWIASDNSYVQELFIDQIEPGKAMLAITRTNQQSIPIQSTAIGSFSIVIQDIILGTEIDTFILEIDSVRMISDQFQSIPTITDKIEIIVANDTSQVVVNTTSEIVHLENQIKLYPNPSNGNVFLETPGNVESIHLIDQLGRRMYPTIRRLGLRQFQLDTSGLPPGIYWAQIKLHNYYINKKLIYLTQN